MSSTSRTEFDIGHPAPDRHTVSGPRLAFGVLGAGLAWSLQFAALSALGGVACDMGDGPASIGPELAWAPSVSVVVNLAALAIAAAALLISFRNLRRTRSFGEHHPGGLIDAGEGRTRFLSIWGIAASVLFVLAIGFNTLAFFWSSLCAS